MKTFYAYIRVSTVKQGEKGSSLQEQKFAIEAYAKRHNLTIVEWFEEKETAAKRGRQVFNRMLKLLVKQRVAGVIIHKIDRSARNLRDWADLGEMIDRGIEIHFAHESLDLKSRSGRLSADIQAVVAADFIRNLRDEVRKGFIGRLRQGLYPLPAPHGYKDQGRGLPKIPDPAMAPLVRRAFELYGTGQHSLFTLGAELYRLGLRSRRGGRVSRNGLSTMLNNEFYIGIIHIRRTGERFPGVHEPLIRKSLFDRVQMILDGRTKNLGLKHDYLYRKTLRCTRCGFSLIAEQQKGHVYYRCHSLSCPRICVREEKINAQVDDAITKLWIAPEELPEMANEFERLEKNQTENKKELLQSVTLGLAQLDERLVRLTDAYIDRLIDKQLFEDRKKHLLHERALAQEKVDQISAGTNSVKARVRNFLELVKLLSDRAKQANPHEKRDLLKMTTSNLRVDEKSLVVNWDSPFQILAGRCEVINGEPQRDRRRTFAKKTRVCANGKRRRGKLLPHPTIRPFVSKLFSLLLVPDPDPDGAETSLPTRAVYRSRRALPGSAGSSPWLP